MSGLQAVKLAGGIMPPALLGRIQAGEVAKASLTPVSYHLAAHETVRDAAARSWSYLRGAYTAWREADAARQPGSSGTGLARDRWLLPLLRELGYGIVPALTHGHDIEGTHYPISHAREHIPVHLLGPDAALDRRNPGMTGAARAPQAMVQEYLNRSEDHLWAVLSNGLRLRLLRDSTSLAGSAYIEFDLEAIFTGELYAEFLLLFQVAHQSRLEKRGGVDGSPADCWMEDWRAESVAAGTRALDKLRDGVETAIGALGSGFLRHPDNRWLVVPLRDGQLSTADYHRALLRLVYRLLFTFVAEDRDALLDPAATPEARTRYANYFSTARLRRLSNVRRGGPHPDLWQGQRLILAALGGDGLPQLGIPPLGGLFDPDPRAVEVPDQPHRDLLHGAELANLDLLAAIRALAWVSFTGERRQAVDYAHLGAEELGSVYESLLELIPRIDLDTQTFTLQRLAGNERKTTGSYYTPPALVSALLDTTLDPVLDQAVKGATTAAEGEERLLAVTVCDPASGSGGFLVAAARRIARRLAQLRAAEDEPTPEAVQHALRDVIGRCIYGVDLNDLAAELAKVSLWLEALEPGKPLGFLDARIRVGNSLIGTTPTLLAAGVPDEAFKEITGDDKTWASAVRKKNKSERSGQAGLFDLPGEVADVHALAQERVVVLAPADHIRRTRAQAAAWEAYERSDALRRARMHADAWTAAFVWPLRRDAPPPPTTDILAAIAANPDNPALAATVAELQRLAAEYRFFHWHLEFPEVFERRGADASGQASGFTCVIGNPPWELLQVNEVEFLESAGLPEIAELRGQKRKLAISNLQETDEHAYERLEAARQGIERRKSFVNESGRYPRRGSGKLNLYALFAEAADFVVSSRGQWGMVLPTGIGTDMGTSVLLRSWTQTSRLRTFFAFNEATAYFEGVTQPFALVTVSEPRDVPVEMAADLLDARDLSLPDRKFSLSSAAIRRMSPNTGALPLFGGARAAQIIDRVYDTGEPVRPASGGSWSIRFKQGDVNLTADSGLFRDSPPSESAYRLYEGKMIWVYEPRYQQYVRGQVVQLTRAELRSQATSLEPQFWVRSSDLPDSTRDEIKPWRAVFRDTTNTNNPRTLVPALVPEVCLGNTLPYVLGPPDQRLALVAVWGTYTADFVARNRLSGKHVNFFIADQLPVPSWHALDTRNEWLACSPLTWITSRLTELFYTSSDMAGFAKEMGLAHPPFVWDSDRRLQLAAELEALVAHLLGLSYSDLDFVLDSFPKVRAMEIEEHGEFLSRRLALSYHRAMQTAIDTGVPYSSPIDPPPGHGPRHRARKEMT